MSDQSNIDTSSSSSSSLPVTTSPYVNTLLSSINANGSSHISAQSPLASSLKFEFQNDTIDTEVIIRQLENSFAHDIEAIKGANADIENDALFAAVVSALGNVLRQNISIVSKVSAADKDAKRKCVRVYMDGCFDIMHSGHFNAIRQAKSLGDILVVGVHSDAEILKHKGPPVMNEDERLAAVRDCKWIDEVVFDTPYNPSLSLLNNLKCDFCVHGDDMPIAADGTNAYSAVQRAGRLRIIKRTEGVSTTDLVGRLLLMTKDHHLLPMSEKQHRNSDCGFHSFNLDSRPNSTSFLPTTWRISQFANNRQPLTDDKVVYIGGAFDLFHVGHMETLAKARSLGSFLYVGVHDDESVNKMLGKNYPIMNLHERVLNVLSCKWVDEVILGAPPIISDDLIRTLNIAVVATGGNVDDTMNDCELEQRYADVLKQDKLLLLQNIPRIRNLKTADIVERIVKNRVSYEQRNASKQEKDLNYQHTKEYVAEL